MMGLPMAGRSSRSCIISSQLHRLVLGSIGSFVRHHIASTCRPHCALLFYWVVGAWAGVAWVWGVVCGVSEAVMGHGP
jgi:hypothetical protein